MKQKATMNRPFESLPKLLKERQMELPTSRAQKNGGMPSVGQPPSGDDDFSTAMKDVTPISDEKKRRVPRKGSAEHISQPGYRQKDPTMYDAMEDSYVIDVTNLPEYMEGTAEGLSPMILDRLRKGEYSIQKVIDLHGLSAAEAEETFKSFIVEAIHSQICCVKVIHGRGLKSRRGPVLKEKMKQWIIRAIHRRWVAAFCSAKMSDGGPGATIMLLRTKASKKKLHIYG